MQKFVSLTTAIALFLSATAGWAQNAEAGKAVFKKCKACHQIGPNAQNKTGPILNDIVGRQAGSLEGFKYRKSIVAAGEKGLVWSEEEIAAYLEDPKNYLRAYLDDNKAKSGMAFKLKKKQDRLDGAAYLSSIGS